MPSYLVTGASRGIGYAFIKVLASDATNTVIGIVRNKAATEEKLAKDNIKNVAIYQADIVDRESMTAAATEIQKKYDSIDYLICNAGYISPLSGPRTLADFSENSDALEHDLEKSFRVNVTGQVNTINAFIPLVRKSSIKKVIAISSGFGDLDLVNEMEIDIAAPYAISKAALNMLIAKYNATYKSEGMLFMAICPGSVATDGSAPEIADERDAARLQALGAKFMRYAPNFTGPVPPEDSVRDLLKVVDAASLEKGSGGSFVSHFGNKQWL